MVVELVVELIHVETQRDLSDDIQVGHNPHYSLHVSGHGQSTQG